MKVMIIDDSEIEIFVSSKLLGGANMTHSIQTYLEASEAIQYLENHKDQAALIPDVILLDIHMPLMNGFQFIERLEKIDSDYIRKIKVFVLSSTADQRDVQQSLEFEYVKEVFEKPLDVEKLAEALGNM